MLQRGIYYTNYPLQAQPRPWARITFFIATALVSFLILNVSASAFHRSASITVLILIVVAAQAFCISAGISKTFGRTILYFLCVSLLAAPMVLMLLGAEIRQHPHIFFWISLTEWCIIALVPIWNYESGWSRILLILGTTTTTASLFCRAGESSLLPYAIAPIREIQSLHLFLDVRIALGSFFGVSMLVTAAISAFSSGQPHIPTFPIVQFPSPERKLPRLIAAFFSPFFIITNYILVVFVRIFNAAWLVFATVVVYLGRTVKLAILLLRNLFTKDAVLDLLRVYGAFFSTLASLYLSFTLGDQALSYLEIIGWTKSAGILLQIVLKSLALFALSSLLSLIIGKYYLSDTEFNLEQLIAALPTLLLVFFFSSIPLYIITFFDILPVDGFNSIGLYSFSVLCLATLGLLVVMLAPTTKTSDGPTRRNEPWRIDR